MTDDTKFIARPKVRFCQNDNSDPIAEKSKCLTDHTNIEKSNKPKIISIVPFTGRTKIVKLDQTCENREGKGSINTSHKKIITDVSPLSTSQTSTSNENPAEKENERPLKENRMITQVSVLKSSNKPLHGEGSSKNRGVNKVLESQNHVKPNVSKTYVKGKAGKENETLDINNVHKNLTKRVGSSHITKYKVNPCTVGTNTNKANVACKTSAALKPTLNKKSNVMPCYKYSKISSEMKPLSVKKTVIRDVIVPKIKPSVGSKEEHKKSSNKKIAETAKDTASRLSRFPVMLTKPKYCSILWTENKLNEMKKQKIIPDIEHLPASYRHLINGKISNALDFSPDETIYKNLVDLSVDESQLPNRLTRSKDPEPRQKDAVPELFNFFIPVSTEECYTAVSIKPRTPEIVDNSNPFKISDMVFEWKYSLDHE